MSDTAKLPETKADVNDAAEQADHVGKGPDPANVKEVLEYLRRRDQEMGKKPK